MSNMTLMFQEKDPEFVPLMGIVKKYAGPRFLMSKAKREQMIAEMNASMGVVLDAALRKSGKHIGDVKGMQYDKQNKCCHVVFIGPNEMVMEE